MARVTIEESTLAGIADAIRDKTGTSELISPLNFPSLIESISGSGGTGIPSNIVMGEFTPQNDLQEYTVTHNKGKNIVFAAAYLKKYANVSQLHAASVCYRSSVTDKMSNAMAFNNFQGSLGDFAMNYTAVTSTDNDVTFYSRGSGYLMKAGYTYAYFIVLEG